MDTITYRPYSGEHELPHIISLVQSELSEPYVVYTYRYFLHQWSACFPPFTPHSSAPLTVSPPNLRPHLSFLVRNKSSVPPPHLLTKRNNQAYAHGVAHPVGVIVCKQSPHRDRYLRGYIAMLSVDKGYRKRGIGMFGGECCQYAFVCSTRYVVASALVRHSINVMQASGAQEVKKTPLDTPHQR